MANGKKKFSETKLGSALKKVSPHILDLIGDSNIPVVSTVASFIDKFIPEKKAELQPLLEEYEHTEYQELLDQEKERTERLKIDMLSDSWLSKNIRPLTLIYFHIAILLICILDACNFGFKVAESFIELFKWAYMTALSFYFIGREIQKFTLNKKK